MHLDDSNRLSILCFWQIIVRFSWEYIASWVVVCSNILSHLDLWECPPCCNMEQLRCDPHPDLYLFISVFIDSYIFMCKLFICSLVLLPCSYGGHLCCIGGKLRHTIWLHQPEWNLVENVVTSPLTISSQHKPLLSYWLLSWKDWSGCKLID